MKNIALATVSAVVIAGAAQAQSLNVPSGAYNMDPTHSSIVWKVSHFGLSNYTGKMGTFNISLDLDASNVANSKISATIDPTSVDSGFPFPEQKDFDAELEGPGWLESAKFPEISFASTGIEVTGDNTGVLTGDLTFLGVTKPVSLDVTLNAAMEKHPMAPSAAVGVSASGTFDRTEFGFNTFAPAVGAEVTIEIEAEFLKAE